ncbi:MAG TPA: hypothetical protein VFA26_07795, partial [Gemmataceae bacterium]|nr:hypothetical protein [Gemmataceae bacterium]
MSTPPASVLAPPGAAPAVAPAPTPDRRGGAARALGRWCDPEWLPFAAVLLTPALVWALLGDARRAGFFLGAAAWVATLKWLGWLLFGRFSPRRPAFALFPAEVFVGLAVVGVWFYLRNLLGLLWPASYSLRELAALPVLAAGLHLLHGLFHLKTLRALGWRGLRGEALRRLAAYGPYVFLLAVALAKVSSLLGVQGSDAVFYVTATRVFLHDGLFRQVH